LFYDNFGKIDDFLPNFRFSRVIYEILKSWKTDKLKQNKIHETDKLMEITFHILKNASECQIDAIFRVKGVWLWGTQSQTVLPRIYRFL